MIDDNDLDLAPPWFSVVLVITNQEVILSVLLVEKARKVERTPGISLCLLVSDEILTLTCCRQDLKFE